MKARWIVLTAGFVMVGLAAVPLTLNRLLDLGAGPAVRLMSFTPYAVLPYAVGLVLAGGVALASPTGRRAVVAVAATCALGLGVHLWWLAPAYVGETPAPADGAPKVTVLTANLYEGRADAAALVDVLREESVDIAVLQEITFGALEELEAAGIDDLLPHRVGEPNGAVDGTMVLTRVPAQDVQRLDTNFQSWLVTVPDSTTGSESSVTVVAAHPTAPVAPTGAALWRADHAALLSAATAADADLVLGDMNATADHSVLGDMNATADHSVLRDWFDAGFRDSQELTNAGLSPTWPSNGLTPVPGLSVPPLFQLDHVLVGPRLTGVISRTVDLPGTDHRAVLATVASR